MPIPLLAIGGGALFLWALGRKKQYTSAQAEVIGKQNETAVTPVLDSQGRRTNLQTSRSTGDVQLTPQQAAANRAAASDALSQRIYSGEFVDPFTGGLNWSALLQACGVPGNYIPGQEEWTHPGSGTIGGTSIDLNNNPLQQLIDGGYLTEDQAAALAGQSPALYKWQSRATQARIAQQTQPIALTGSAPAPGVLAGSNSVPLSSSDKTAQQSALIESSFHKPGAVLVEATTPPTAPTLVPSVTHPVLVTSGPFSGRLLG